jgi:oxygen-dependent protoporphyrinogen oxidase
MMLGGNYVCGVALGKCVESGYEFAKEVSTYVKEKAAVGVNA